MYAKSKGEERERERWGDGEEEREGERRERTETGSEIVGKSPSNHSANPPQCPLLPLLSLLRYWER